MKVVGSNNKSVGSVYYEYNLLMYIQYDLWELTKPHFLVTKFDKYQLPPISNMLKILFSSTQAFAMAWTLYMQS